MRQLVPLQRGEGPRKDSYSVPPPVPVSVRAALWADDFDYAKNFGVGGLDKELRIIVRRAFLSHMVPKSVVHDMGIGHVGGILLYGPPGCGKTTLVGRCRLNQVDP
jgi:ATP-dependent 26S proteasome regulatory subunit